MMCAKMLLATGLAVAAIGIGAVLPAQAHGTGPNATNQIYGCNDGWHMRSMMDHNQMGPGMMGSR